MAKARVDFRKAYAAYLAACAAGKTRKQFAAEQGYANENSLNTKLAGMKKCIETLNANRPAGEPELPWPSLKDARGGGKVDFASLACIVQETNAVNETIAELSK